MPYNRHIMQSPEANQIQIVFSNKLAGENFYKPLITAAKLTPGQFPTTLDSIGIAGEPETPFIETLDIGNIRQILASKDESLAEFRFEVISQLGDLIQNSQNVFNSSTEVLLNYHDRLNEVKQEEKRLNQQISAANIRAGMDLYRSMQDLLDDKEKRIFTKTLFGLERALNYFYVDINDHKPGISVHKILQGRMYNPKDFVKLKQEIETLDNEIISENIAEIDNQPPLESEIEHPEFDAALKILATSRSADSLEIAVQFRKIADHPTVKRYISDIYKILSLVINLEDQTLHPLTKESFDTLTDMVEFGFADFGNNTDPTNVLNHIFRTPYATYQTTQDILKQREEKK